MAISVEYSGHVSSCAPLRERFHRLPGGRRMRYIEFGDPYGVPVFGFHGTPGSSFMFRLADEPARLAGIRLIAPERPGFGKSTFQKNRCLADWPDDLCSLADALQLPRFGVAGVSGGGPYAAACAALLPGRVTAAALISPIGPLVPPEGAAKIGAAQHLIFRILPRLPRVVQSPVSLGRLMFLKAPAATYRFILMRASKVDFSILSRPEVRLNLLEGVGEGFRPGVRGMLQEMKIFSAMWGIPFQRIEAPVFVWQGTADRNVPPSAAFHLAELIPHCQLFKIEGGGHYWVFENMDTILKTLKQAMTASELVVEPSR